MVADGPAPPESGGPAICIAREAQAASGQRSRTRSSTWVADFERDVDSVQVMDLAAVSTCSAYDCEFVALAMSMGIALVTEDARIVRDFPDVAVTMTTVLAGP